MEFSWSEEKEDILVEEWRKYPCLYDSSSKFDKVTKANSYAAIAEKLETTPVEVNKRMNSLRTMYSRQLKHMMGNGGRIKNRTMRQEWINVELAFLKPYVKTRTAPPNDTPSSDVDVDDSNEEIDNTTDDDEIIPVYVQPHNEHVNLGINSRNIHIEAAPEQYVNEHSNAYMQEQNRSTRITKRPRVDSVHAFSAPKTADYFSIFGQHIANELRQIKDTRVLEVLKKKINDAIFEAKIGLGDFSEEGIELPHRQSSSYWTA